LPLPAVHGVAGRAVCRLARHADLADGMT
jgi:hypothetical protein